MRPLRALQAVQQSPISCPFSMDISIIIVSYNVKDYLRQCLRSVWASVRESGLDVEVFVVDNNSADHSVEYIREVFPAASYPTLHIIAGRCNVGFGRANNLAVRQSKGKYILFLNPDTVITEHTLNDCFRHAEAHDNVGAIGVKMLNVNGEFALESRRGLPTPWVAFCKMAGLGSLFPRSRTFGKYYMRYLDHNEVAEIEILSGAFMFCSRRAIEACGVFDEQFFMYGEDIDLSYRFLKGKFHNWYVPTPILHYKGESTHKGSYNYVHTFYEAMLIFFRKHFKTATIFLSIPVKMAIIGQAAWALMRQQARALGQYLYPNSLSHSLRLAWYDASSTPQALVELAELWDINIVKDAPDVMAYDADKLTYADLLKRLEGSHQPIGFYYPSNGKLVLASRICE